MTTVTQAKIKTMEKQIAQLRAENGRLRAELDEARLYLEMALIYDNDEKEERFNELLNETLNCTEHPFLNDWQLPCKCYLCRSYG